MKQLASYFARGLSTVLPAGLTLYLVWWLGSTVERLTKALLLLVLPEDWYRPGMGLVAGAALIVLIGALTHAWLMRVIGQALEGLVERTPIVKSVYGAIRDVLSMFSRAEGDEMQAVVAVEFDGAKLIGLVTRDPASDLLGDDGGADTIAVYLPMGYQIGGFMVVVPRSQVIALDMSVEDGLRIALTAGVKKRARTDRGDSVPSKP
ncbi:DUF502 domain-containing protein [Engelhardtia mirabilis]|uniref:DUF502 domain-containing protein n=1 Tax=Engelhardtia mirabilis TaxID=2528011 RepID=A0A518BJL8_9BACT|nr:hypothetical protein Pla133_22110 [Planctomycetes bacterium Pla133]QDV01460.1 hypothetical protein Pla86_22110 [Planctomycetes bacterium Pla86]